MNVFQVKLLKSEIMSYSSRENRFLYEQLYKWYTRQIFFSFKFLKFLSGHRSAHLQSQHQEDCKFEASLKDAGRPCLTAKLIQSNFELPSNANTFLGWPSWGLTASWLFESVIEMSPLYCIIHLTVFNLVCFSVLRVVRATPWLT